MTPEEVDQIMGCDCDERCVPIDVYVTATNIRVILKCGGWGTLVSITGEIDRICDIQLEEILREQQEES